LIDSGKRDNLSQAILEAFGGFDVRKRETAMRDASLFICALSGVPRVLKLSGVMASPSGLRHSSTCAPELHQSRDGDRAGKFCPLVRQTIRRAVIFFAAHRRFRYTQALESRFESIQ
jgi:hypothetical protein